MKICLLQLPRAHVFFNSYILVYYQHQCRMTNRNCVFIIPVCGGAMQDLNALGPRLQLDLLRDWPKLALDRELWREVASRC